MEDGDIVRLHAPRPRPHACARDAPERGHGRALREDRGLLARLRRLDAPLRRRARQLRRERRDRRRPAGRHRRGARVQAARRAAGRARVLRRRHDEHRHLPRVAQPRAALEDEDGVRLREQPLGRVDAGLAALAGVGRHVEARARVRHALDQGRRPGRRSRLRSRARGARVRALRRGPRLPRRRDLPHARPLHRRPAGLPLEGRPRGGRRARSDQAAAQPARPRGRGVRQLRRARRTRSSRPRSSSRRTAPTRSPKTP